MHPESRAELEEHLPGCHTKEGIMTDPRLHPSYRGGAVWYVLFISSPIEVELRQQGTGSKPMQWTSLWKWLPWQVLSRGLWIYSLWKLPEGPMDTLPLLAQPWNEMKSGVDWERSKGWWQILDVLHPRVCLSLHLLPTSTQASMINFQPSMTQINLLLILVLVLLL